MNVVMDQEIKLSIYKKQFLLFLLFSCVAISLLAPLASNVYLPETELSYHVGATIQAKMAIEEGQFPIRIAPWQQNHWGNPWFQFHSPLPYTLSGLIYKFITPDNPYVALKILIFFGLIFAGWYIYCLIKWLLQSETIALLTAIVYLLSPYLLINIHARGDFTEAMAQMIIPALLYYFFRLYFSDQFRINYFFFCAFSLFCLITTCVVTFVYTSLFLGLFLIVLTFKLKDRIKALCYAGLSYLYALILSAYFIFPILITEKLLWINKLLSLCFIMPIESGEKHQWLDYMVDSFEISKWLNPLPTLLSMRAMSPIPLPGQNLLSNYPIYLSIGLPIILSVGLIFYMIWTNKSKNKFSILASSLFLIFCLAFFAAWSPINFWSYLPSFLTVTQFSYRLLTQVMWTGSLLFSLALFKFFGHEFNSRHLIIGIILICLCNNSWLPIERYSKPVQEVIHQPDLGYGQSDYLVTPDTVHLPYVNHSKIDISLAGGWLITNKEIPLDRQLFPKNSSFQLQIDGNVPSAFTHPISVDLFIDGKKIEKKVISPGPFRWNIPLGQYSHDPHLKYITLAFVTHDFFIPMKTTNIEKIAYSIDDRPLSIKINSSTLIDVENKSAEPNILDLTSSSLCQRVGKMTQCHFSLAKGTYLIQLPIFYYPKLLNIKVNGVKTPYYPSRYKDVVLASLLLPPGQYTVTSFFQGLAWANWISFAAWMIAILVLLGRCRAALKTARDDSPMEYYAG